MRRQQAICAILPSVFSARIQIHDIWAEAREGGLSAQWLVDLINSTAAELDESQRLNFMRWPILGQQVHMNPQAAGSYEGEIGVITRYVNEQMAHLDKVIGYTEPVVEPDDPTKDPDDSGIESVDQAAGARVYAVEGGIAFRNYKAGAAYTVVSPDGRVASQGLCTGRAVTLASGLYIVSIDGGAPCKLRVM